MSGLTHIDDTGAARIVDVGDKDVTQRTATAVGVVTMKPDTLSAIIAGDMKKGDVLGVARIAGIMAAKRTHELVPLCHPIAIDGIDVSLEPERPDRISVRATVRCSGRTGVEMEALTAASVACLTVYDMAKAIDRGMSIDGVRVIEKSGGASGDWHL